MDDNTSINSVNSIKSDIKMFQDISDNRVSDAISDAYLKTKADKVSKLAFDNAVRNYARHLLYCAVFDSYGGVTSSSVMGQSQTMSNPHQTGDTYLNNYNQIVSDYGTSSDSGMIWSK